MITVKEKVPSTPEEIMSVNLNERPRISEIAYKDSRRRGKICKYEPGTGNFSEEYY